MNFFSDLQWRGLVHQTTNDDGMEAWLAEKPRTLYAGFDPTAASLHVGHMMGLIMLRRFQQAGHRPIAVVGGATGMIGDPSGKSDERNLLSKEDLQANVEAIGRQMARRCAGAEYVSLAAGEYHFAVFTRMMPWDHAPGVILHREAGGYSAHADGAPYVPGQLDASALLLAPDKESWRRLHRILMEP